MCSSDLLGYARYLAGGGDGPIPMAMARRHAAAVAGIYAVDVGYPDGSTDFAALSPDERAFAQWIHPGGCARARST